MGNNDFVSEIKKAATSAKKSGRGLLVVGPANSGKETALRAVITYRYAIDGFWTLSKTDVVGSWQIGPFGSKFWAEGPLTSAMRNGERLLVTDFDMLYPALRRLMLEAMKTGQLKTPDGPILAVVGFTIDATVTKATPPMRRAFAVVVELKTK